ncbi:GNAT family N-acetyltransferase [Maricaulis parjimensis]|uniref:GNAT family N-acetyltransferase n=1 Tax=Maricaulis parjimensis TaxID=144023 RepID=UPI00193A145C|nr:GNAT family N-acetyltransferase [Maricaulis parjimensis]
MTDVDITIRPTTPDQTAALAEWAAPRLRALPDYISHGEILSGRSLDGVHWVEDLDTVLARDFAACLESGGMVFVAETDGQMAGFCAVFCQTTPHGQSIATIEDMLVDDSLRRDGVGRALLKTAEAFADKKGADHILLESGIGNAGAHDFFERQGYGVVSKVFARGKP